MLDIKLLRNNLDETAAQLLRRGFELDVEMFNELETRRKSIQTLTQSLQSERNSSSKAIGMAIGKGEDPQPLKDAVASLGEKLKAAEVELAEIQDKVDGIVQAIPNLLHESVPIGKDESENLETQVNNANSSATKPEFSIVHLVLGIFHQK